VTSVAPFQLPYAVARPLERWRVAATAGEVAAGRPVHAWRSGKRPLSRRSGECNDASTRAHLTAVSTSSIKREVPRVEGASRLQFETVYRENVGAVTAFFARRCRDPQQVADLTSQTFVEAIKSAGTFQGRGTPTAWLIAIARRVYANHLADQATGADLIDQLGGRLVLAHDEIDDLLERMDAQRDGEALLQHAACLSALEREAIELVDLMGLTPKDAAHALGVSPNALRVRLFRAHKRLRKELGDDRL
jgi:RNA polymerase sigma-70 factor (ECF subfamily)